MDGAGLEFKDGILDSEGNVDVKIDSSGNVGIGGSPSAKLDAWWYWLGTTIADVADGGRPIMRAMALGLTQVTLW